MPNVDSIWLKTKELFTLNQSILVLKGKKRKKRKNTLKACVSPLLDISQSDSMASRTAVILIG